VPEFDHVDIASLLARKTLKWGRHGGEVLGAWVAEMDFALAPEVRTALHDAVDRGMAGYPLRDISTGLPSACAAWLTQAYGWQVRAEWIFLLPDILTGVGLGIEAYSRAGSAVVLPTPAYPPFFEIISARRRRVIELPMVLADERPMLDIGGIDAALAAGAGTVVLCNPHNPLGRVYSRAELSALSDVVTARGARVIADEVHGPITYPGHRHVPYASVSPDAAAHTITLVSASKAWNIAGLKCCQAVLSNEADVRRWREIPFHDRHGASTLGIAANIAAYTTGDAWRQDLIRYLDQSRSLLASGLIAEMPDISFCPPQATYLAWLDCRRLGLPNPAAYFLRHADVALSDGAAFGSPGHGFVRLNFATSHAILERIIGAMGAAIGQR
jgi:cysteine-S-conjugate beta-lyase